MLLARSVSGINQMCAGEKNELAPWLVGKRALAAMPAGMGRPTSNECLVDAIATVTLSRLALRNDSRQGYRL